MARYNYANTRGALREKRILELLAAGPLSARAIAAELHLSLSGTLIYLSRLRAAPQRVHVAGFDCIGSGRETPLYGLGELPDAVFEAKRKPKQPVKRIDAQRAKTLSALATPMTAAQLGVILCISAGATVVYVTELRAQNKAYIKTWKAPGKRGDLAPVYALGNRLDAPKPRQSRADRYQKDKADREKYERLLAKRRMYHRLARARKTPQSIFSALGL